MRGTGDSIVVQEVRRRAMRISARFHHDVRKYGRYLKEQQKKHAERVVSQPTVV